MFGGVHGEFELAEDHAGVADDVDVLVDVGGFDFAVGAGDDDDGVLAVFSEVDGGEAGGAGTRRQEGSINASIFEILHELWAVNIIANMT